MANIKLPSDELFTGRPAIVADVLEPLFVKPFPHCGFLRQRVGNTRILGVGPGLQLTMHPEDCWFRTFASAIWCQYLEYWLPLDPSEAVWFLESANLHVSTRDAETLTLKKLVLIHSEPNFQGSEPAQSFKRSPHLHVVRGPEKEPIGHCHFPLNLGHLAVVLSSVAELTKALASAVRIIRCEVVDSYARDFFKMSAANIPIFPWDVWEWQLE